MINTKYKSDFFRILFKLIYIVCNQNKKKKKTHTDTEPEKCCILDVLIGLSLLQSDFRNQ